MAVGVHAASVARFVASEYVPSLQNISLMFVTLDVSHLEMSALKLFNPLDSPFMLSMDETSQLSMAPYMAMVAVGLALKAWTAAFREAVLVKVPDGGADGDGGGEGGMAPPHGGDGGSGVDTGEGGAGEGGGKGEDAAVARSTGIQCDGQVIIFSSRSRPSARRSGCPSEQTAGWRDFELGWPMACV